MKLYDVVQLILTEELAVEADCGREMRDLDVGGRTRFYSQARARQSVQTKLIGDSPR